MEEEDFYKFRGMLKRAGYSTRERWNMHGAAITSAIATTAAIRYSTYGFTNDWKEEAAAWIGSLPAGLVSSIFTVPVGYLVGFSGVLTERIIEFKKRNLEEKLNLQKETQ